MKKVKNWEWSKMLIFAFIALWLLSSSINLMALGSKSDEVTKNSQSSDKKIKIGFKLSGGYGYLLNGAGDLDKSRKGIENALSYLSEQDGYSTSFDWERTPYLPNFTAEFLIRLTPNFGISIGSGFFKVTNKGKYSLSYNTSGSYWEDTTYTDNETGDITRSYKVTAVPLDVDLYFFLPLGKSRKLSFFSHAGVGYYFGKLTHNANNRGNYQYESFYYGVSDYKSQSDYSSTTTETVKCNSFGFHGGLGVEMKASSWVSLGVEFFGRYVNFKNWEGHSMYSWDETYKYWSQWSGWREYTWNNKESEYGSLWTYDIHNEDGNRNFTFMSLLEEEPDGSYIKNARKASVNLNSYGLSFSIQFHFDLF